MPDNAGNPSSARALSAANIKQLSLLVETRCQELSSIFENADLQKPALRFWNELPDVILASEFAFEQLLKFALQPVLIDFLTFEQSLWRTYQAGEHADQLSLLAMNCDTEEQLMSVLRIYRNLTMVRVIWREATGAADLWESTSNLSELACAALDLTIHFSINELKLSLGEPYNHAGQKQSLGVLGLGKLGAKELNLSSDIDLMFVYGEQGTTVGGNRDVDNQNYFIALGQKIIHLLQTVTSDGFVFRVDMRLRPFGKSGPLSQSINAMIAYYENQGREWERYALVKASHVAGDGAVCAELMSLLLPFIYRRYLDYSVFESLREMKALINREVSRNDANEDIKVGSGGIREVEFIVQTFQMIRGGKNQRLRDQQLEKVYWVLANENLLPIATVRKLVEAYLFLRWVEHRLQGLSDLQTHRLPSDSFEQMRLALSLGFVDWNDFKKTLARHRVNVRHHFNQVIEAPGKELQSAPAQYIAWWHGQLSEEQLVLLLGDHTDDHQSLDAFLKNFRRERKVVGLQSIARRRLNHLMPYLLERVAESQNIELVLPRVLTVIGAIVRRSAYISLLNERPEALGLLIKLCDASPWVAEHLALHPILLDELLNAAQLLSPPPIDELAQELEKQMARLPDHGLEEVMELLRHFKLAHELRVAASETTGTMPIMKVSDYLTFLAVVILKSVLQHAWTSMIEKYGIPAGIQVLEEEPVFMIVGYGKLGGLELSYSSDLDLVFLLPHLPQGVTSGLRPIDNALFYTRLAQKVTHMLTARTVNGSLYDVDLRLRPSGDAGLLVSTLAAFRKYQMETAWTWEHQALVRARVIASDAWARQEFEDIRHEVLVCRRDPIELTQAVSEMRIKMREQLSKSRDEEKVFDLKQSRGGIVDIEFIVQFVVLKWAADYPELTQYTDNVRILEQMAQLNIVTLDESRSLISAYLYYRACSHRLALQKEAGIVPYASIENHVEIVTNVWAKLLQN